MLGMVPAETTLEQTGSCVYSTFEDNLKQNVTLTMISSYQPPTNIPKIHNINVFIFQTPEEWNTYITSGQTIIFHQPGFRPNMLFRHNEANHIQKKHIEIQSVNFWNLHINRYSPGNDHTSHLGKRKNNLQKSRLVGDRDSFPGQQMGVPKNNGTPKKNPCLIHVFIRFSINYKPSILGVENPLFLG